MTANPMTAKPMTANPATAKPATGVIIGLDIGTTSSKALIRPVSQAGAVYEEQPTPWATHDHGRTDIDPHRLTGVAVDLIGLAAVEERAARALDDGYVMPRQEPVDDGLP